MATKRVLGVFSRKDYRKILAALHPDNFIESRKERAAEAFQLIKDHEDELCTEREKPYQAAAIDDFPQTREELIARMMAKKRQDAINRALRKKAKEEAAKEAAKPQGLIV